jgi:hypothetical protein
MVPWMLAFGSDGDLYVSCDDHYDTATTYGDPADYDMTGLIIRIFIGQDGEAMVQNCQQSWAAAWRR